MYIRDKKVINNAINFLYMESSSIISDDVIDVLHDVCYSIDKEFVGRGDEGSKCLNRYSCYNKEGDLLTQFVVDDFNIDVTLDFINNSILYS